MMHWLSSVALILYLSLLVMPQVAATHAPYLTPLANSQLQAISPLSNPLGLSSEQDCGDDNDNGTLFNACSTPLYFNLADSASLAVIVLPQPKAIHPVRAPPFSLSA